VAGVLASVPGVPVSVGVLLGDALVLGLLLGAGVVAGAEGEVLDGDCGGSVGDVAGVGCCVAAGEDGGTVELASGAPDGAHDAAGAESSAIVGVFGFPAPGPGVAEPIMAACFAGFACGVPTEAVAAGPDADGHCGTVFTPVGATVLAGAGVAEAGEDDDGPAAPGPAAGFGAGAPFPSVLVPSTLSACPPVSTLELTCTTACRSGATASVAATAKAIPASTAAGRNHPRPLAARSTARSAADSSGTRGHEVIAPAARSRRAGTRSRDAVLSPRGKGDAGLSPRGKATAGQAQ